MDKKYYDEFGVSGEISDAEIKAITEKERKTRNKIVVFLVILLFFYYAKHHLFLKHYEYINDFHNIDQPIQTPASGEIVKEVDGIPIDIQFVAKYQIDGVVISKYNYYDYDYFNKFSPIDVGIAWGFLADEWKNAKWENSPARFLLYRTKNVDWYHKRGGDKEIGKFFSNNHLIAADAQIEKEIKNIKREDYVRIEGYLAYVDWMGPDGKYTWHSSTKRDDYGDGACEIIYVTKVSWLKEK